MNAECPDQLGQALVIGYAIVGPQHTHLRGTTQIVEGRIMPAARAMVIVQYPGESWYYVFGCYGDDWATSTDTMHDALEDAVEQLDWEYLELARDIVWKRTPPPSPVQAPGEA